MMNKLTILRTFSFFLICLSTTLPLSSQTPTASFSNWKDNKKAAYSIIHDDYSDYVIGIFKYADPIATARGIKLCFGAITNSCGLTEWANARTMLSHGHECINHSHNHLCGGSASQCSGLSTYGSAQFATELGLSSQLIETNTGVKPRFFIHPYDASSTSIINYLTGLGYLGTRAGTQDIVNQSTFTDFMRLNFYVYSPTTAISTLNQAVNQAVTTGGYVIREFHGIADGSWAAMTVANYTSHLDYVKTQMDNGNIWSATTTEAITYKMQRDAFQPVVAFTASTNIVTVSFNILKTIDPSVLRTPITLNVNLNGILGNYSVKQNGTTIPSVRTGNIVTVNVYPHQGNVILNCIDCDPCVTDITPPVLTACPSNLSLTTTGTTAVASWIAPTATDNCSTPSVSFATSPTLGLTNGGAFPIGTSTVTYTATDAKNNTATCSFNIVVTQTNPCVTDIIPPVLTACPTNISLTTTGTTAVASWIAPTATDNCSTPSVSFATSPTLGLTNGGAFSIGTSTVTYTATDAKNNTATCSFNIVVTQTNPCVTDITPPVLTVCPTNISLTTTGTTAVASWIAPTATDNCSTPSVSFATSPTLDLTNGGAFSIGTSTVTYTATDAKNNTAMCRFTVTVTQQSSGGDVCTQPSANITGSSNAINVTGITTSAAFIQVFSSFWSPVYSQQVSTSTATIPNLVAGSYYVKVTVLGVGGKWPSVCEILQNITVTSGPNPCTTDVIPPVLTACPANMNLTTTTTSTVATWTAPTATDNCSTPSVSFATSPSGLINGGAFPIGTNTITYTTTDTKNNTATCRFTVAVTQQTTEGNICTQPATNIVGTSNAINISGITTAAAYIQVFTSSWSSVNSQQANTTTVTIPNLPAGNYIVKVTVLGAGGKWPAICDLQQNVTVGSVLASQSQAILALEVHAEPTSSVIEWVNNTGYNNDYFTVEKADNKTGIFEPLMIINNKSLDKDMMHYVAYDKTPNEGDNSYRITLTHNDGSTKVSDIKTLQFKGLYSVRLFPNPANDVLTLDLSHYKNQNVDVYLYNYFGHLKWVKKIEKITDVLFDIPISNIETGSYQVRIQSKHRRAITQPVIIAH